MQNEIARLERLLKVGLLLSVINTLGLAVNVKLSYDHSAKVARMSKDISAIETDASEAASKSSDVDTKLDEAKSDIDAIKEQLDETHAATEEIADKLGLR